jgi:hypothetical protein
MVYTEHPTNSQPKGYAMAEGRKPDYIVRIKEDSDGSYWFTGGAAWSMTNGKEGFAVRLTKIPVGNWDGSFILVKPISDDAPDEAPEPPKGKTGRK